MLVVLAALLLTGPGGDDKDEKKPRPKPLQETVVVTASRERQSSLETTALVDVISANDLELTPAPMLDEKLRQIPGFSLFRRTSGLTAHPTTQGFSLRGIGPSGASRSLALFDNLPLNDPFGGWVYWNRFPTLLLDQVEVVRGSVSQLYGSSSMGGAIQLLPRSPQRHFEVRGTLGNHSTGDLEALASDQKGDWGWQLAGRVFDTAGFFVVPKSQRGNVDEPASSEFQAFFGRVLYKRAHFGFNFYREDRENGTPLQRNHSRIGMFEGGVEGESWQFNFYTQTGLLESSFSRILPDRSQEFPTAFQQFESTGVGSSFSWRIDGETYVGVDWRQASWDGNRQNLAGVFVQRMTKFHPKLEWQNGLRFDLWQNQDTHPAVSPRTGVLFKASEAVSLRASAYHGFRAPTLNELFRPFRVGNILTSANPDLSQERLWGAEAGADLFPAAGWLLRINFYWNRLLDAVNNVTVSVSPELILRQRQNAESATIRGVEAESIREWDRWRFRAAYLFSDSRFATGPRVPQTPRHQGVVELDYRGPVLVRADARWVGSQFDDDQNRFNLGGYGLAGVTARRPITDQVELFFSVQNVFNRAFPAGATPVERLGDPRLMQFGVRLRLWRD